MIEIMWQRSLHSTPKQFEKNFAAPCVVMVPVS